MQSLWLLALHPLLTERGGGQAWLAACGESRCGGQNQKWRVVPTQQHGLADAAEVGADTPMFVQSAVTNDGQPCCLNVPTLAPSP